jgi:exosortase/archaeosortase family protein
MGRKSRTKKETRETLSKEVPQAKLPAAPSPFLRITLVFAVLVVVFEVIAEKVVDWSALQLATASLTTFILQSTGLQVVTDGIHMTLPNAQWEIIAECTAIRAQLVFLAFILAYPASLKARALAVGAGLPFLFTVNIIRLVALGWLTALNPALASYFHDFVWQMGFLFLVIGLWLVWIERVVNSEKRPAIPA